MDILVFKPGHDGQIAYVQDGKLTFSIEAEKDNWPRHATISPSTVMSALAQTKKVPDVIALSGWTKEYSGRGAPIGGGYAGHEESVISTYRGNFMGSPTHMFTSSHERAHLMCAYGLSPYRQGEPCYALVWESEFGAFYHIDEHVRIRKIGEALRNPGVKYNFLYGLADPTYRDKFRLEDSGKLMAIAGYGKRGPLSAVEQETMQSLLVAEMTVVTAVKQRFKGSAFHDIGVRCPAFGDLARKFSDRIFDIFANYAAEHLDPGLPLLISGGCGLNCDWNTAWQETGRYRDVFIPPCCNDSGAAIGTAIDAQFHFTQNAKLEWAVYAGEIFSDDVGNTPEFSMEELSLEKVARLLAAGKILAWVQGRCEIGPRALGNRSILASPFEAETRERLNKIKGREEFRPIAPVCIDEDFSLHFEGPSPSPFMLYFHRVSDPRLKATTHVDGSGRAQTVTRKQNPALYDLLSEFKRISGVGVLCNTSLNFKGAGFINRMSDLQRYAATAGLDGFIVHDRLYSRKLN